MNELVLQSVYFKDRPAATVSAARTACDRLVITPQLGATEDGQEVFTGALTLVHTMTGRTIASHHRHATLGVLAEQLAELDWNFADGDHFVNPDNAEHRDLVVAKIREWRMSHAYDGEVSYAGQDAETKAARHRDPATTMLSEQIDSWIKMCESDSGWPNKTLDENPEMFYAKVLSRCEGYGLIYLLAVLRTVAPKVAGIAARDLVMQYDAGDGLGEWIYQWRDELAAGKPLTLTGIPDHDPLSEF